MWFRIVWVVEGASGTEIFCYFINVSPGINDTASVNDIKAACRELACINDDEYRIFIFIQAVNIITSALSPIF